MKLVEFIKQKIGLSSGIGATPGYEGAGMARRLSGWNPSRESINALLNRAGDTLTARARWLTRNSPYAARGKQSFVGNAIGTGIYPSSKIQDRALRKEVHQLWLDWTDEADADGLTDYYGLQAMAAGAMFEAGECFVRIRPRRRSDMETVPFQLQLLEAEQLPLSHHDVLSNGNRIRHGIEFNQIGKRVAYHFLREHPGEGLVDLRGRETVRVPAESVLHLYEPLRPGQLRGQTRLAAAMVKTILLDMYDDAELDRKKVAAMFAGFIRRPADMDGTIGEEKPDDDGRALAGLSPGTLNVLLDGEEITFSDPADVGGSYEAFQRRTLLAVSAAMNIPYQNVTGDLLGVSYSSIRAGILEFRRCLEQWQHATVVYQMNRPVWRRFLDDAVLFGLLSILDYAKRQREYRRVEWIPEKWDWVDPVKDRQGQNLAREMMSKSSAQIAREEGNDIQDVMDEEEEFIKELVRRGLPIKGSTQFWNVQQDQQDANPKTNPIEQTDPGDHPDAQDQQETQDALIGSGT